MLAISENTIQRVTFLFTESERDEATEILDQGCGNNLPFLEESTQTELERFQFAALKLSKGNLDGLRSAVTLAATDWRDLLVAAGFANSVDAHNDWNPRKRGRQFRGTQ